ncbi:MAG TPA: nuclear transport factor 2 family protein [Blastocatellia bacterium]|nr:nuclear transport factor 2 family protein [Blastocatellia bacterium]
MINDRQPASAEMAAVEEVNDRFYRALEACELTAMEALWLHTEWVRCVHPGWELLVGWNQVRESWARIFQNSRGLRVMPSEVAVLIAGDFAWVSCTENLVIYYESGAPVSAVTTATNLFQRVSGEWLMVLHHASPVPASMPINESETVQ